MWRKDSGYMKDIIGQLGDGEMNLDHMEIHTKRGPQESIFVYVQYCRFPKKEKGKKQKPPVYRHMAGIGGYGWDDPLPRLLKAAKKKLPKGAEAMVGSQFGADGEFETVDLWWKGKKGKTGKVVHDWIKLPRKTSLQSRFVGITRSTAREFFKWLEEQIGDYDNDARKWFNKIDRRKKLRFNQGDAFFAHHFKKPIPATAPGKARETILTKRVKQMGKEEKKGKK